MIRQPPLLAAIIICAVVISALRINHHNDVIAPSDLERQRIQAADQLTEAYAHSRFADWHIYATAAKEDCSVLLIHVTNLTLEDSLVEGLYYGAGAYGVTPGGLNRYYQDQGFRGLVFNDGSDKMWTYGNVTESEMRKAVICGGSNE